MGYICSHDSSKVIDKFSEHCRSQTGSSNVYRVGDKEYFFEISRNDQPDNGICGAIYLNLPDNRCKKVGTFKVDGSGTVVRGPAAMKACEIKQPQWPTW